MMKDVLDAKKAEWFEAMKAKGHSPSVDEFGLDIFAFDGDYHNGPACSVCGWSCCWHCDGVEDIPACNVIEGTVSRPALSSN